MAKASSSLDAFAQTVERALEKFNDPQWLGQSSPLAAPYVLGMGGDGLDGLNAQTDQSQAARGRALQAALHRAAADLSEDQQHLLQVSFFGRDLALNNAGVALKLNLSEATYYRRRAEAIATLAGSFDRRALPPLRSELPRARPIVGRSDILITSLDALRRGESVALLGNGGMGKTSLGAHLMQRWGADLACWYTFRPGLNDQFASFLFTVGYFLHRLGVPNTWQQLVADEGRLHISRALGLIRHDLMQLAAENKHPLLCVDEIDLLRPETNEHANVIHLIEELRELIPVLLIGQHLTIDARVQQALIGLTDDEIAILLTRADIALNAQEIYDLRNTTRGNPALLTLFIALQRAEDSAARAFLQPSAIASVQGLLFRLWRHLDEGERAMIMTLAVFDSFAPADAFDAAEHVALDKLVWRELAEDDARGGVRLVPYAREFGLARIPPEALPGLHLRAGRMHEARAEFTVAARHYIAGRQPAMAVWLWLNHRQDETGRGHVAMALNLFSRVSADDLTNTADRKALTLLRAFLLEHLGQHEELEAVLIAHPWTADDPITPYAKQMLGNALLEQGRVEQAVQHYRAGLDGLYHSPAAREVFLRNKLAYALLRDSNLSAARNEAHLALADAEYLFGSVEQKAGNLDIARESFEHLLQRTEQLPQHDLQRSNAHSALGHVLVHLHEFDLAAKHLRAALEISQRIGKPISIAMDKLNLSWAYVEVGDCASALPLAREGYALAESLRDPYLLSWSACNVAEAEVGSAQWDAAENFALHSLREEIEAHRPYALTVLGRVRQGQERWVEAEQTHWQAIQAAQDISDPYAEAAAWQWLAETRLAQNDSLAMHAAFEQCCQIYTRLHMAAALKRVQGRMLASQR